MSKVKLGILEFGYREVTNSLSIIEEIIEYAIHAEKSGFSRFWLGEHHYGAINQPFTNPEILLALIAGMTNRIRIGTAGIQIAVHAPYFVATNFKLLNNLFANRIDLGFSKGFPGNEAILPFISSRIQPSDINSLYDENVAILSDIYENEEEHFKEREMLIPPYGGEAPDLWYLSTSYNSSIDVIKYKMNFCRSIFHAHASSDYQIDILNRYRENFYERNNYLPAVNLALAILLEEDLKKAKKSLSKLLEKEKARLSSSSYKVRPVTIDTLYDLIHEYKELYSIDEFIIYDISPNSSKKIENLENIKAKFSLV